MGMDGSARARIRLAPDERQVQSLVQQLVTCLHGADVTGRKPDAGRIGGA